MQSFCTSVAETDSAGKAAREFAKFNLWRLGQGMTWIFGLGGRGRV